ncbi:AAA-like domain-containing protein, partial [Paraburkholderia sp. SIMBA_061]
LGSQFYIQRRVIEEESYREIQKPGALLRIKAPQEMGKTSLLLRLLDYGNRLGYATVNLDLQQADQEILSQVNRFLRWVCANITYQLNL